jgi:uncharacterized membrane protein
VWASLVVCVLGLLVAAYLTFEHYTESTTLACSESATINCLKVTTSPYADVFGIPFAVLGVVYFAGMGLLCLPAAWRRPGRPLRALRVAGAVVGVLTALYLVWVELFRLDAICLYCTGVHVLTFVLFVVVALGSAAIVEETLASEREYDGST